MNRERDQASASEKRNSTASSVFSIAWRRARIRADAVSAACRSPSVPGRENNASIFRSLAMSYCSSSRTVSPSIPMENCSPVNGLVMSGIQRRSGSRHPPLVDSFKEGGDLVLKASQDIEMESRCRVITRPNVWS